GGRPAGRPKLGAREDRQRVALQIQPRRALVERRLHAPGRAGRSEWRRSAPGMERGKERRDEYQDSESLPHQMPHKKAPPFFARCEPRRARNGFSYVAEL